MKTAYIFHDSFSTNYADWYPWLKSTLEARGYRVIAPEFPTPAGQSLESWRVVIKNFTPSFDAETVLIGHGTGAMFALRMIEESGASIKGLMLVAPYAERIGHAGFDRVNETFLSGDFKWETIRERVSSIRVFAGSDDPFVPLAAMEHVAKNLGIEPEVITDGGHFNRGSGFTQFIVLADAIRALDDMITKGLEMESVRDAQQSSELKIQSEPLDSVPEQPVLVSPSTEPVSSIRTMYQDMTKLVTANEGSVASSLLETARIEESERKQASPAAPKNLGYLIGSLIAVVVAVAAVGYVVGVYLPANQVPPVKQVPSLLTAETHAPISLDQPSYAIMNQIRAAYTLPPAKDEIKDIYYTSGNAFAKFPDVLRSLEIAGLPDSLGTELMQPMFMHGTTTLSSKPAHFLILPGTNYDVLFRGMRSWEPTMFRDIGIFMNVPDSFLKTQITKGAFVDEMIANRTIRVLRYHVQPVTLDESTSIPVAPDAANASATGTPDVAQNFISTGIQAIQNNPFANVTAPYQEGDLMIGYFFLTERTVVIVDSLDSIPEILSRYANRQIYNP